MSKNQPTSFPLVAAAKKSGAGTAPGGGVNFQANATAIVAVHILRGVQMGWLDGVTQDLPIAVWAESGLAGDDIRVELANGKMLEIQAKKGLSSSNKLWEPLEAMADAIAKQQLDYGVLAVAPDSSNTISEDLAKDIIRLGQGRTDNLKDISQKWLTRVTSKVGESLVSTVCSCIRIQVIHALSAENIHINAAKELLRFVCDDASQAEITWDALYRHAVHLIEIRGRWELKDLISILNSNNISIRNEKSPASRLNLLKRWAIASNDSFTITGTRRKIGIENLLPMHLEKISFERDSSEDITSALSHYRKKAEYDSYSLGLHAIWTARFKPHVVVVAGPGLGKSTMIKQLAYRYALDGFVVLKVDLKRIATATQNGAAFERVLLEHALSGSGINPDELESTLSINWVVLADGLDECGKLHDEIAERIAKFASGHPNVRVIITTRPVGYTTAMLEEWTHYRLLPPAKKMGAENLAKLITAADKSNNPYAGNPDLCHRALNLTPACSAIVNSPQLLGMAASLILSDNALPQTLPSLYRELIGLFNNSLRGDESSQQEIYDKVIDIIGWTLLDNPLINRDKLIKCAAEMLASALGKTALSAASDVRDALKWWESVGLIEQIQHQRTPYLTFIHKTFSEYVAARFITEGSIDKLNQILDSSKWNEVVKFAIELGLADTVIATRLARFISGETEQLLKCLNVLKDHVKYVSDQQATLLLNHAFEFITLDHPLRFQVGVLLADISEKKPALTTEAMMAKLNVTDQAIRLIAWGMAASIADFSCDSEEILSVLREILLQVEDIEGYFLIARKVDSSDRELLHRIGLMALKAQSDDNLINFSETELKGKRFTGGDFAHKRDLIFIKRGIDITTTRHRHPNPFKNLCKLSLPRTSGILTLPYLTGINVALGVLAKALSVDNAEIRCNSDIIAPKDCIQFSAFISACNFMEGPAYQLDEWKENYDSQATQATLNALVLILPLESNRLAVEARSIQHHLDASPEKSLYSLLPRVDMPEPDWKKLSSLSVNLDAIKPALLHPVTVIAFIAANILETAPMSLQELRQLFDQASGASLRFLSILVYIRYPQELESVLVELLCSKPVKNEKILLELLVDYEIQPLDKLIAQLRQSLISESIDIAISAVALLRMWHKHQQPIVSSLIEEAIRYWQSLNDQADNFLFNTPLNELLRLKYGE